MKTILSFIFVFSSWCLFKPLHAQSNRLDSLLTILSFQQDSTRAKTLIVIGNAYRNIGQTDSAVYYHTQYLDYQLTSGTESKIFKGHVSLGATLIRAMKLDESLTHFLAALSIAEKLQNYSFMADAKRSIGYVLSTQKRQDKAIGYFVSAEQDLTKVKDTLSLIQLFPDLGYCKGSLGDTAGAINYFQQAFDLCDSYEKDKMFSPERKEFMIAKRLILSYNISDFLRPADLRPALARANKIWEDVKDGENAFQQFQVLSIIADIHNRLEEYPDALHYAEKALATFSEEGNDDMMKDVYHTISIAASHLGQHEKAYTYLDKFRMIGDSLYNSEKNQVIADIETKYETAKKEAVIRGLYKDRKTNRIMVAGAIGGLLIVSAVLFFAIRSKRLQKKLLLKEQQVQRAALEKKMAGLEQTALRAQMNPHFIFNCLNSVQRFVNQGDIAGVNLYLATFANLIRQTLENSGKTFINLSDEIAYLKTYLDVEQMRSPGSFDYTIEIAPGTDIDDIYIPGMIIQPFVENCIRHGLPAEKGIKGKIRLVVSKQDTLIFIVEDNGPGIKNADRGITTDYRSMGRSLTEKRIVLYNDLYTEKISLQVEDISEKNADESGTRITLKFTLSNN